MAKMRPTPRKGFPGGFFLFVLAAILIMIGVQTFTSSSLGRVSFSHQAEHLTNLNLTFPEENRKIAQNENLVTFTGKFRGEVMDESSDRFHYLEILNKHHELVSATNRISKGLDQLQKNVRAAADLDLHLSGATLPRSGCVVVGPMYDTPDRDGAVVIQTLSDRDVPSLPLVQKNLILAQQTQSIETIEMAGKGLRDLASLLRSPALGIGNETVKQELKAICAQLNLAVDLTPELQLRT